MDSKDIRQTIDVKHHHEDIFGDPNLSEADGTSSRRITSSNYDTVTELCRRYQLVDIRYLPLRGSKIK
jgi:hypothetical protein